MTHEQINLNAYDEARRHFISMVIGGYSLEKSQEERAKVFEASKRSRCTNCLCEKHVSKFYDKGCGPQAWCINCQLASKTGYRQERAENRAKWKALKEHASS